jgi:lipopolysaccharide transport system ATP-binding protein
VLPRVPRLLGLQSRQYVREFWALKDISFELKRGETLGIIGRNGSGKSTLLQMVCGTLTPSAGTVQTNGRVAALLELGSGFNPEFTGRENVYMNGAILGLDEEEITRRFDDIAAFADIGDFIEQPVKTYSSGMMLRLAFAVVAHVDADILVVDEALAVGDAVFTQKCMRFIRSFLEKGTLLFVSHDMGAVQNLCHSVLWLSNGKLRLSGPSKQVVEEYLRDTLQQVYGGDAELQCAASEQTIVEAASPMDYEAYFETHDNLSNARGWKTGSAELLEVSLELAGGQSIGVLEGGERVRMVVRARAHERLEQPILGFLFRDRLGQDLFGENTLPLTAVKPFSVEAGQIFKAEFHFRLPMLPNGQYAIMASVADGNLYNNIQHHYLHDAVIVNVSSSRVRWGLVGVPFDHVSMEMD